MTIELSGDFKSDESKLIKRVVGNAVERACAQLFLQDVKIHIFLDDQQTIPEWGVGGYCENADQIEIALSPGLKTEWEIHLPRTIAHEWHHLARWRGPGYGTTLPEVIISEGLAQHFEIDCFPGPPSFFSTVLSDKQRSEILAAFIREFQISNYDHARWFFGKGEFPFQAGYDLSFNLIGEYLLNQGTTAAKAAGLTTSQLFRTLSSLSAKPE
jgi:uncharacterized protein YjaZ